MTIQHEVVIDLNRPKRVVIPVTQEDSTRRILLSLLNNGLPYNVFDDLASGEQLMTMVEYRRADGTNGMYDTTSGGSPAVTVSGTQASGKWVVLLDGVCFTVPGWAQINVRFMTESGKLLHSFPIMVDVYDTACPDESGGDPTQIESIADMKAAISELFNASMSEEAKNALLNLLAHVAYVDEHGQDYYDTLEAELFRTADLVSISAVFEQGSAVIYDTDDLDTLKQYLTVTATYEDLSTREITAYTLSGTLTEGTSTITVSYGGKTATFDVAVTHDPIPSGYVRDGLIFFLDGKQLVDIPNGTWTDVVGGKEFTLTDCTASNGGVVFNGESSHGDYSGVISDDWHSETVEAALGGFAHNKAILCQANGTSNPGICLAISLQAQTGAPIAFTGTAETARAVVTTATTPGSVSANNDRMVLRKTKATATYSSNWSINYPNYTTIGAKLNPDSTYHGYFNNTIYAIRVYNRKLTEAEMMQNQQADKDRYGL